MKRILSISLIAAFTLVAGVFYNSSSANAQTTNPTQSVRCTTAQANLNTLITQVDKTKVAQSKTYAEILAKIDEFITSAQTAGYDVTDLAVARGTVNLSIGTYQSVASSYATSLMATKNLSCGESNGAFTTSLVATRASLADTRTSSLAVRTAITTKAIPELTNYATWLKENATTGEAK